MSPDNEMEILGVPILPIVPTCLRLSLSDRQDRQASNNDLSSGDIHGVIEST